MQSRAHSRKKKARREDDPADCPRASVHQWLLAALELSGMQQTVLSRELTATLGRTCSKMAVHHMVRGKRFMQADEMLAIASICRVPLPSVKVRRLVIKVCLPIKPSIDLFTQSSEAA